MTAPMLEARDVTVEFGLRPATLFGPRRTLTAVNGVSFVLERGESLGVVGESGSGKSTLARALLRLVPLARGAVLLDGEDLAGLDAPALRARRRLAQLVFQDPQGSLDPRMTAGDIIAEPLDTFHRGLTRTERRHRAADMMRRVGLSPAHLNRYAHEFSGGQCQRIGIARALIAGPRLLVCDEPVSALDVSIQAQIINLLDSLRSSLGLTLLFIAHDLRVVRHLCDRVMVMHGGRAVEIADADTLFASPQHSHTRALIDAVPEPDPRVERARLAQRRQVAENGIGTGMPLTVSRPPS